MPRQSTGRSEIDDIFAKPASAFSKASLSSSKSLSKGKGKAKVSDPDPDADDIAKVKKKKKKKIAQQPDESQVADSSHASPTASNAKRKRPEPETVLDPSAALPTSSKRLKVTGSGKAKEGTMEDQQRFRDSRGTGPRKKTDEGFSIYKEDELGIGDEGGDTPLCPFDCDCCF